MFMTKGIFTIWNNRPYKIVASQMWWSTGETEAREL